MKKILIMLVILPAFFGCAWAEEIDGQALEIFESGKMEQGLKEHELEIIGSIEPAQFDAFPALSRLWNAFLSEIQNRLRENLGFAVELFGLILFSALAGGYLLRYVVSFVYGIASYLVLDFQDLSALEVLRRTRALLRGRYGRLLRLYLSFIPQFILGALSFGIGFLWIGGYFRTARAFFYKELLS